MHCWKESQHAERYVSGKTHHRHTVPGGTAPPSPAPHDQMESLTQAITTSPHGCPPGEGDTPEQSIGVFELLLPDSVVFTVIFGLMGTGVSGAETLATPLSMPKQ